VTQDGSTEGTVAGDWGDAGISFGEQGAKLTYGSYLQLPALLAAQDLKSEPPAHDELLFITIHQVYELWFQQLLHEASTARDAICAGLDWWAQAGVEMPVHPGDHVVFPAAAGVWVEVDEERLLVCRVTQLLGVLESAALAG